MKSLGMVTVFVIILLGVSLVYGDLIKLPQYGKPDNELNKNITENEHFVESPLANEGLIRFFDMSSEELIAEIGEPLRIDPSAYGYDWWIYGEEPNQYVQFGIDQGTVVTAFALGKGINVTPFEIGESREDILKKVSFKKSLTLNRNGNEYRFELSDEELQTRPLVKQDDLWMQLYMDKFKNILVGVRYMTPETLLIQRPYSIEYRGNLLKQPELDRDEWQGIEDAEELQIFNMTNVIRQQYGVAPLQWHEGTAKVAYQHSKEMDTEHYFSHTSPVSGDLGDRLQRNDIEFIQAGENIAANYIDGIAALIGWLNSEGHRKTMLSKEYTHLGVGVYEKYYTQNFIVPVR